MCGIIYGRYWMYMGPPTAISSAHQLMAVKPYRAGPVQRHHASTVVSAFLTVLRASHKLQKSPAERPALARTDEPGATRDQLVDLII